MCADQLVDLATGEPDLAGMPRLEMREAAMHRLSLPDKSYFSYGPEQGSAVFREYLVDFLSHHYDATVRSGDLLITAGASHALDLVLTRLCQPGDTVFVENPTYFFALDVFADTCVRVVSIPTNAEGLDVDALEAQLAKEAAGLLYTIPVFHNPTGATLPVARRRRLTELARRFGFLIVADEVYQMLGDKEATPPLLYTFDSDRVISISSFSKILGLGIRLGWTQGSPDKISVLSGCGVLRSGGGVAPVMNAIAAGVSFRPGPYFSCGQRFRNCLRLCFTYNAEPSLALGAQRLAGLIRANLRT